MENDQLTLTVGGLKNYLVFTNPGEADIDALITLGVNIKSEGAIGFFGTGVKIAIAVALRLGAKVDIHCGSMVCNFYSTKKKIRDRDFGVVTMKTRLDAERQLGWTTELGKTWKPWMAYREFYCNATDEDAKKEMAARLVDEYPVAKAGITQVVISDCDALFEVHDSQSDFILDLPNYLMVKSGNSDLDNRFEVYNTPSKTVFYKGVKVLDLEHSSQYTFNIKQPTELTEDRTLKDVWLFRHQAAKFFTQSTNTKVIETFLKAPRKSAELDIFSADYHTPSQEFKIVLQALSEDENVDIRKDVEQYLEKKKKYPATISKTAEQEFLITTAVEFFAVGGIVIKDSDILVFEYSSEFSETMTVDGKMYLSDSCFDVNFKHLLRRMLQEYCCSEGSSSMNLKLTDEVLRLIGEKSKGLNIVFEPNKTPIFAGAAEDDIPF